MNAIIPKENVYYSSRETFRTYAMVDLVSVNDCQVDRGLNVDHINRLAVRKVR